jgi:type IV secretory pathway TrbL component
MTELPESGSKRRATQVGTILRGLSGVAGLAAILAGTVLPVLFAVSADEAWELIPALGFVAFCGFVAFWLIRFAVKGPKSS